MKIFIQNVPEKAKEKELIKAAEEFGKVVSASIIKDIKTEKSTGNAYIEMASKEDAKAAIKGLKTVEFKGVTLKVKEAASESETTPTKNAFGKNQGSSGGFSGASGGFGKSSLLKGGGGANRGR
ncbi:MAG: RNA-binding protein [Leptospirales bacterium]